MSPTCKQVAEQLSENIDEPLAGMKWIKLKLHLMACRYCRLYGKQIEITNNTIKCVDPDIKPTEETRKNVENSFRELHTKNNDSCK